MICVVIEGLGTITVPDGTSVNIVKTDDENVTKVHKSAPKVTKSAEKTHKSAQIARKCRVCGTDISDLRKLVLFCSEKCRKKDKSDYMKRYFAKRNNTPIPGQETIEDIKEQDPEVEYCRHCQAYGIHNTRNHVFEMPASTAPLAVPAEKIVKNGEPLVTKSTGFTDPWDCESCRSYGQTCKFHIAMEKKGKRPPKYHVGGF